MNPNNSVIKRLFVVYFVHVQDDLNFPILGMFTGIFSLHMAHIQTQGQDQHA